ncbi:MAG: hypothetical protein JWM80_6123 [Cyanobacteria bacterium RYN_339]|nr:hypothetical protein [Cyanobacteria bacterium RYN_339]
MEALRKYLQEMPQLATKLLERLGEVMEEDKSFDYNNAEEMRLAYKEAQQVALERINEAKVPYYALTYPQTFFKCPTCALEIRGAYYEISNPITMNRGMFRVRSMHEFLDHGQPVYTEPIINMSDTLMGDDEHHLDVKKLAKILDGLPIPDDVMADLQAGKA